MSKDNFIELLAPAGSPEAGYSALFHGADAVYLGLKQFSARSDAENFSLSELSDLIGYAHQMRPKRKVYVTLNTLLKDDELPDLVTLLEKLTYLEVDALITQDMAVVYLVKHYFPQLTLHASTQMALHNKEGALAAQNIGFERVVLARELTLKEIQKISLIPNLELEIFVHGALCYAYSGLCLLSSMLRGRSGNRGSCAYNCRNGYTCQGKEFDNACYVMSMKDLSVDCLVKDLRDIGVSSLKIEGRKKSPAYVAAAVRYYRAILDDLPTEEILIRQQYLQTIFSRPQTHFFMDNAIQNVVEPKLVGHLGAKIGKVEQLKVGNFKNADMIRFVPSIDLMIYDGLQLPIADRNGKPYGFSIEKIFPVKGNMVQRPVFEIPAGSLIEVPLPSGHPRIENEMFIYCASSQRVKKELNFEMPKPGAYKIRQPIDLELIISKEKVEIKGKVEELSSCLEIKVNLSEAKNLEAVAVSCQQNFSKLGDTNFFLRKFEVKNSFALFAPASMINQWRRMFIEQIEAEIQQSQEKKIQNIIDSILIKQDKNLLNEQVAKFILKIDNFNSLSLFTDADFLLAEEIIIDIGQISLDDLVKNLPFFKKRLLGKLRLALPVITRETEIEVLLKKINYGLSCDIKNWQVGNLSGFSYLPKDCNITGDFSLSILNACSAKFYLEDLHCQRITISPEASKTEIKSLISNYPNKSEVILYQNTPLAYSQSCIYANMNHGCVGKQNCKFTQEIIQSNKGETLIAVNQNCRTLLTNVLPYTLIPFYKSLSKFGIQWWRCDFCYIAYTPETVLEYWRELISGNFNQAGYHGNFINSSL